ncbi:bifunctional phosphopantothenoylcysteine decarboxylase/phosphopantothenate--cysteine ligase CoaBC [Thalassotalea sp. HSM 43]|uniref:bifunctional phosphopantothenoylcysteine decarboxylase/phosphopantothenate--cysteine ligase CoaBC n=1 Tax=Thalassotalea sp. HSM 43 TaxID=2552945 RepID=UPI001080DAFC|nr:bifunctional phosphopantothenoylcysteine decarboxylase/phosphopantothenate--cysteine ligase CoaBC [Thalassotalea sp. HSM 43]QBY04018.1 bifunctional phosphopantothenoylcysteine decarboxylase/phosphopantothenate--cysteine ligase CoaBC [Thalassotalea sp. HSM 43]
MFLQNKNIVLGVTGGIAAYKCAELVRRLKDHGANIRVVMTNGGKAFITPLTLQAVSGNPVADSLLDPAAEAAMGHIELAKWADLVLIAPASANTLARMSAGMADDLLMTIVLATAAPIAIAPAMNQQMWAAAASQQNLSTLISRGVKIWGPAAGEQACGDVGYGRMLEPDQLVQHTLEHFSALEQSQGLQGQHWLITAGPTREAIDPVRYISNHSSGKMGYAIADAARQLGAKVTLVSGPVNLPVPEGCQCVCVQSADDMYQAVMNSVEQTDVFVACAAVADYKVAKVSDQKIKKTSDNQQMAIELVKNPDIVASVAAQPDKPFTVGFAAETQDVESYAKAKLQRKNLDMIAANDVSKQGQGFNSDDNALSVFWQGGDQQLPLMDKQSLARQLVLLVKQRMSNE